MFDEIRVADVTPFGSAVRHAEIAGVERHHEITLRLDDTCVETIDAYVERGYAIVRVGCRDLTLRRPIFEKGNEP